MLEISLYLLCYILYYVCYKLSARLLFLSLFLTYSVSLFADVIRLPLSIINGLLCASYKVAKYAPTCDYGRFRDAEFPIFRTKQSKHSVIIQTLRGPNTHQQNLHHLCYGDLQRTDKGNARAEKRFRSVVQHILYLRQMPYCYCHWGLPVAMQ
jgi:hypothetical protein